MNLQVSGRMWEQARTPEKRKDNGALERGGRHGGAVERCQQEGPKMGQSGWRDRMGVKMLVRSSVAFKPL